MDMDINCPSSIARTAGSSLAEIRELRLRGGRTAKAVRMLREDPEIVGQPVPLGDEKFLIPTRVLRVRLHEGGVLHFAAGRVVGRAAAAKAAAKHPVCLRRHIERTLGACATVLGPDEAQERGPEIGTVRERTSDGRPGAHGTTYYEDPEGGVIGVSSRGAWQHHAIDPETVRGLLLRVVEELA